MILMLTLAEAFAEEAAGGFTLGEMWEHAGFIARSVIITLILMMLGSIFVFIERLIAFRAARNQSITLAAQIVPHLQKREIAKAVELTNAEDFKASYLAAVLRAGLGELRQRLDHHGLANARRAVDKAMQEESAKLRRGMTILATVGSTAPFVGLLGTTFGVINAFQGMASAGSGLAAISAGISEALITTGVGIGVAVLGVWAFNYFNLRIEKVNDELASSEADFIDWAEKLLQDDTNLQAAK